MTDVSLNVDVFDLLERLGVERVHTASGGAEAQFSCPFHGDERPSAYMNVESGATYCHSCHARFRNPVGFVAKVMGVPYATSATWLREAYGIDFKEPEGGSMGAETDHRFAPPAELPGLRRPSESWQEVFASNLYGDIGGRAYEYIRARGFTANTIADWGLGYDVIKDRLTIPVRDIDGELVGYKARALDEESLSKYLILGDQKSPQYGFDFYEASQVVFGIHRGEGTTLVMTEGELDAIALAQIGVARPVALGMSYLSDAHVGLLLRECRELVAFFDSDESGVNGVWSKGVVDKLQQHVKIRVVEPHESDPAKLVQEGRGEEALGLIERAEGSVALGNVLE